MQLRNSRQKQRGAALILMLAVLTLGASWYLVKGIETRSADLTAAKRKHNAEVLGRAKVALLGYIAAQAAKTGENNPGAFPCPEAAANYGTDNEGIVASNCSLPKIGRFPWKTIGTEKFLDADNEPLWYVVATGWAKPNSSTNTVINSECTSSAYGLDCWTGQLTVDSVANSAVALLIAPGAAMSVVAATGCTARTQTRSATGTADFRDYLECENATSPADATFVSTGPSDSFNDQVLKVTAAEVVPLVEAAVAKRFESEFPTPMRSVYSNSDATNPNTAWPTMTRVVMPFAAPVTSTNFQGAAATSGGMFPAVNATTGACGTAPCTPTLCTAGSDPRCDPDFVAWIAAPAPTVTRVSGASYGTHTCTVAATSISCTIYVYRANTSSNTRMVLDFAATASNVGMALRQLNANIVFPGFDSVYGSQAVSGVLNSDGSARVTVRHRTPNGATQVTDDLCSPGLTVANYGANKCYIHSVTMPIQVLSDHPLVDSTDADYGWFVRNNWHQVTYYAVAPNLLPSGTGTCVSSSTCLTLTNHASAGKQRALAIIAGRALAGQTRPVAAITDLLEGTSATGAPTTFELRTIMNRASFNDRFVVVDSNP
jgi:hypothetical protein